MADLLDFLVYQPTGFWSTVLLLLKWLALGGTLVILGLTLGLMARGVERITLVRRYLRSKLAPLFAMVGVTLCTAMVIVVISVMGGFLEMMKEATHAIEGDVIITADLGGFPHYDVMIQRLEQNPAILAASPTLTTLGLIRMQEQTLSVQVIGIKPASMDRVVPYDTTLYWPQPQTLAASRDDALLKKLPEDQQLQVQIYKERFGQVDLKKLAMAMRAGSGDRELPGMVPGIEVSPDNFRMPDGSYNLLYNRSLGSAVTLTVVPMTTRGTLLEPQYRSLVVVNEFKSGLYEIDANRVYVPFELLQDMLKMNAAPQIDKETGEPTGREIPARTSNIIVRARPGVALDTVRTAVIDTVKALAKEHPEDMPPSLGVMTWREQHATFLNAVENEKGLVTFLFGFISIVAVVLIGVILRQLVVEKTRDIGILRALGATRGSIIAIFLGYGLVIGVIGGLMGFALGASIVWNINELQSLLGITIWNPQVYYFDKAPSQVDPFEVTIIIIAAVISSVVGAMIPALTAARLNPVESLRYE